MLTIVIPAQEYFNQADSTFVQIKETRLTLEHSLVSLSKWESKHHKAFLSIHTELSREDQIDYVRCMTITQNVPSDTYLGLTKSNWDEINAYIEDPQTATTFSKDSGKRSHAIITSEIIYYWMIACGIPMECQKWHLNRLLTLIRVCQIKMEPNKNKVTKGQVARRNAKLNAARRAKHHSRG